MPHLRISGMERQHIMHMSTALIDALAKLVECPRDHFTIELVPTQFIFDDQMDANGYPMVEVLWFARDTLIQDEVAAQITDAIRAQLADDDIDIGVRFTPLSQRNYYENGRHF
ncbi:DUF1904 domain-containing protein [Ferrimonas kyonanensis]|uniref:DUF1904 domain-containing protein n=1 Tax=Ferrimonas kyonanensis TaxID=364763 RepID=UPI000404B8C1|nr:DUF1904 domain-containing protein [Ferrimonas kyonanensis]